MSSSLSSTIILLIVSLVYGQGTRVQILNYGTPSIQIEALDDDLNSNINLECKNLIKSNFVKQIEFYGPEIAIDKKNIGVWYTDPKLKTPRTRCVARQDADNGNRSIEMNIWKHNPSKSYFIDTDTHNRQIMHESGYFSGDGTRPSRSFFPSNRRRLAFQKFCQRFDIPSTEHLTTVKIGVFLHGTMFEMDGAGRPGETFENGVQDVEEIIAAANIIFGMQLNLIFTVPKLIIANPTDTSLGWMTKHEDSTQLYMPFLQKFIKDKEPSTAGGWVILTKMQNPFKQAARSEFLGMASGQFCTPYSILAVNSQKDIHSVPIRTTRNIKTETYTPNAIVTLHEMGHWFMGAHPFHKPHGLDKRLTDSSAEGIMNYGDLRHRGIIQFHPRNLPFMCNFRNRVLQEKKVMFQLPLDQCFAEKICPQDGIWEPVVGGSDQTYQCDDDTFGKVARRRCNPNGEWEAPDPSNCTKLCKELNEDDCKSKDHKNCMWSFVNKRCLGTVAAPGEGQVITNNVWRDNDLDRTIMSIPEIMITGYCSECTGEICRKEKAQSELTICNEDSTQMRKLLYKGNSCDTRDYLKTVVNVSNGEPIKVESGNNPAGFNTSNNVDITFTWEGECIYIADRWNENSWWKSSLFYILCGMMVIILLICIIAIVHTLFCKKKKQQQQPPPPEAMYDYNQQPGYGQNQPVPGYGQPPPAYGQNQPVLGYGQPPPTRQSNKSGQVYPSRPSQPGRQSQV